MSAKHIKKHLSEKGTPVSDFQAEQLQSRISGFCEEMSKHHPLLDWHFTILQVGTDAFSIEYCHRDTIQIEPHSISPLE